MPFEGLVQSKLFYERTRRGQGSPGRNLLAVGLGLWAQLSANGERAGVSPSWAAWLPQGRERLFFPLVREHQDGWAHLSPREPGSGGCCAAGRGQAAAAAFPASAPASAA